MKFFNFASLILRSLWPAGVSAPSTSSNVPARKSLVKLRILFEKADDDEKESSDTGGEEGEAEIGEDGDAGGVEEDISTGDVVDARRGGGKD